MPVLQDGGPSIPAALLGGTPLETIKLALGIDIGRCERIVSEIARPSD